jgi:hypothetical protein
MRTPESVTQLLYDLYTGHEWEELEEYFIVAEQLILLHGGHFHIFSDVIEHLGDLGQFQHLHKYLDSEEAWREEINRLDTLDEKTFTSITNTFIYFNK